MVLFFKGLDGCVDKAIGEFFEGGVFAFRIAHGAAFEVVLIKIFVAPIFLCCFEFPTSVYLYEETLEIKIIGWITGGQDS